MKKRTLNGLATTALCLLFWTPLLAQQTSEEPLTNAAIVKLVRAGFKDKTVVALIRSRPNRFDLDADRLVELKRSGVSENIILAMLARNGSIFGSAEDVDDEAFFGGPGPRGRDPGDTSIFGSNSGSKGQTKSSGMSGSNEGETVSTGSATVRILKAPTEGGGVPSKLDRTPTLTNESIVKLVQAGFSEGTIIKRIEDSPVDFDLSPSKLLELRKRRVTDAVVVAMTTAMSDDSSQKTTTPSQEK